MSGMEGLPRKGNLLRDVIKQRLFCNFAGRVRYRVLQESHCCLTCGPECRRICSKCSCIIRDEPKKVWQMMSLFLLTDIVSACLDKTLTPIRFSYTGTGHPSLCEDNNNA